MMMAFITYMMALSTGRELNDAAEACQSRLARNYFPVD
jgi:hypothetical protein